MISYRASLLKLVSFLLFAAVGSLGLAACGLAETPGCALVHVGSAVVDGIFLNSIGNLVVPSVAGAGDDWKVDIEGDLFPAQVVKNLPEYGMTLLKIERQKACLCKPFEANRPPNNAKLMLVGCDKDGKMIEKPVGLNTLRRNLSQIGLTGSFFDLSLAGDPPLDGAALIDSNTGKLYGMLVTRAGGQGERYAISGADIGERAALAQISSAATVSAKAPEINFANGSKITAHSSLVPFRSGDAQRARSTVFTSERDWRENTGYNMTAMTSPIIADKYCYFGTEKSLLYRFDLDLQQRDWKFPNEFPIYYPPEATNEAICFGSGGLGLDVQRSHDDTMKDYLNVLGAQQGRDVSFFADMLRVRKTHRTMYDLGQIYCLDPQTAKIRWRFETRFVSRPVILGDKVAFGGLETLGLLKVANKEVIWLYESDRNTENPTYYQIAGGDAEGIWALALPTHLTGGTNPNRSIDPLRLEKDGRPILVERYPMTGGVEKKSLKPTWTCKIKTGSKFPALNGAMLLTADRKICCGAGADTAFAVDAESGKLLWSEPIFKAGFGGTLTYADPYVFMTSKDCKLYAISAVDGKVAWTFEQAQQPLCVPLVQDGVVYIGGYDTYMYALDLRTGAMIWKSMTNGKICGQPFIRKGKLCCTTDDGSMLLLDLPQ